MKYPSHRHTQSNTLSTIIKWALIWGAVILSIWLIKMSIWGSTPSANARGFILSGSGKVVITNESGKKRDAEVGDILAPTDILLSAVSWVAELKKWWIRLWIDKGAEIAYSETSSSWTSISISGWRVWIETSEKIDLTLKHIEVSLPKESITLIEQQKIHSIVYALRGSPSISAWSERSYTLDAGNRIMVSQSDLVNPGASLAKLSDTIDDTIRQNAFFLARNGQKILSESRKSASDTGALITLSGSSGAVITQSTGISWKYIMISSPLDGSIVSGNTIKVEGKTLSSLVTRVVINDKDAVLSNQTGIFSIANIAMTTDTIDIVYKAYDARANLLERWVLSLYSQERKLGTERLIPTTFPASDKIYRITSPTENPYKTTDASVTVSGSVPKGAVEYITVNNFRLKKYTPYASNWYYYANTSYATMKEGFNLYEIRFYGPNSTLLSTQLFTIIKEWGSPTLSWE